MVSPTEKLYWYCQLVLHGHSGSEAKEILDGAIEKLEKESGESNEQGKVVYSKKVDYTKDPFKEDK